MARNCLIGCATEYSGCGGIVLPLDYEVLAPYVIAKFQGGNGATITVGNNSTQGVADAGTAVIKSFSYGLSDGYDGKIEILDEQGGSFQEALDSLIKCVDKSSAPDSKIIVEFGWIASDCNGNDVKISSPEICLMPIHVDVNFNEGRVKYMLHCTSVVQAVFVAKEAKQFGSDGNLMTIKQAIKELFEKTGEPVLKARFLRKNSDGSIGNEQEWEIEKDIPTKWEANHQNKLQIAMEWFESIKTDTGKGIHPTVGNDNCNEIIFWEDVLPACNEKRDCSKFSLGTFIVNGGACSSVVSFNPTINWIAGVPKLNTGNVSGGGISGETVERKKECVQEGDERTGTSTNAPVPNTCEEAYGKDAKKEIVQNQNAHAKANSINTSGMQPITAELRIQGNPGNQFVNIKRIVGSTVAIIVVNPYHILEKDSSCGDWTAKPGCNSILSNRSWMVKGVGHEIKEGSYTTTLNLFLATPGIDISPNAGLGGDGYRVKNAC